MWARRSELTYPALPWVVILVVSMIYRVFVLRTKMNQYLVSIEGQTDTERRLTPIYLRTHSYYILLRDGGDLFP